MNETWWVSSGQLDEQQKDILRTDPDEDLLITGPPGSGKTNILLLRANYVRAVAPRLLFVTFTRTLAEFLKSGPSIGRADQIQPEEILTFMSWGLKFLRDFGVTFSIVGFSFAEARAEIIRCIKTYIDEENPGKIYDVVFVDEVQDFLRDEIDILKRLSIHLNAAGDARQTIYSHREGLPAILAVTTKQVSLINHYRIGRMICNFSDRILPPKDGSPLMSDNSKYDEKSRPSSTEIQACSTADGQYEACIANIRSQLRYISDEPILVLSYAGRVRDAFWDALEKHSDLADIAIKQAKDEYEPFGQASQIRVMTIASSKGSEARAVHILDGHKLGSNLRELAFTAVTRAKTEVKIYHHKPLPGHLQPPVAVLPAIDDIF